MIDFREIAPEVKPVEELHFNHVQAHTLANGIVCYRLPRRNLGVVKLDMHWPFGTRHQQQVFEARTALALCLSGTAKLTAEQINEEFEYQGSSVSFETQLLSSVFHLKSTREVFSESFNFFLECFNGAIYPAHEIDNFKQIEQAGLMRKMQTPRYWAHRMCMESLYLPGSPMASFANVEDIANLDQNSLVRYHHHFLNPHKAVFLISGDVDDALYASFIASLEKLGAGPAEPDLANFDEGEVLPAGRLLYKNVEHTSQVSLYMGKRIAPVSETDMHGFTLLNMMLGGFFGSRLMQEIREERGLTYGIGSFISQSTDGNVWCISGEMNTKTVEEARLAIEEIMQSLITNPPQGMELERAKRYYSGQLRTSFDGPFAMANKLRNLFVRGYSYQHYDTALQSIWKLSTDDLCRLADNYLQPQTFNTVLAGDINQP